MYPPLVTAEAPAPARTRCSVCTSPHRPAIEALRASKMTLQDIHLETQKMGRGFKRETLGKHFAICLNGQRPLVDDDAAQSLADYGADAQTSAEIDFAVMVKRRAADMLRAGQLRVTAQHGLTAQALLDRRAEKAADRDLALNMARLLSGAVSMAPLSVIETRNVTPLEIGDGYAPDDLVDPRDG
jgi:hypothetical protein